jgi:CheY-like chemotaxis protein
VVDDEPDVRAVIARTLREEGYRVLEAGTADEALAVAARDAATLDLLVTDLVMPHMSGGALAKQVRQLRPELGVLFTSGHADDVMRQRGLLEEGQSFLQKPYSPETLAIHVRRLLEAIRSQEASRS